MARRKSNKKTNSWTGALIIEALAVIVFAGLFLQARAQRQQEFATETPTAAIAAWPSMLEQTPFADVVAQSNSIGRQTNPRSEQGVVFSPEGFLNRFSIID